MIDYHDRLVLVTGGASGIGKALAEALAARGARLVVADRDEAGAREVAAETGGSAITCDLSDPGSRTLAGRGDGCAARAAGSDRLQRRPRPQPATAERGIRR